MPEIGPPDPAALEYIKRVWPKIPPYVPFYQYGAAPVNLKDLIRHEADAIKKQAPFREKIVAAVEKATGISRHYMPVRGGAWTR